MHGGLHSCSLGINLLLLWKSRQLGASTVQCDIIHQQAVCAMAANRQELGASADCRAWHNDQASSASCAACETLG